MNPKRILLPATMALAAICLWAPGAGADVFATEVLGEGAEVKATSTNFVLTRPDGSKFECTNMTLHFELIDEGNDHLRLQQLGEATTNGCIFNRVEPITDLPVTMDDGTLGVGAGGVITINTWGTGSTNVFFRTTIFAGPVSHVTHGDVLVADCTFAGNIHAVVKGPTNDELAISSPALFGLCGEVGVEADFTLEAPDGDPIVIHYEETE